MDKILSKISLQTQPKELVSIQDKVEPVASERSLIYPSASGINELIAAAQPLFVILCRISRGYVTKKQFKFTQSIQHEINIFVSVAKSRGFSLEAIEIARLILYKTLEDLLHNSQASFDLSSISSSLSFLRDTSSSSQKESLYATLEELMVNPTHHVDLLEFVYLCLKLSPQGNQTLQDVLAQRKKELYINRIYNLIRNQRGKFKRKLSITPQNVSARKPLLPPLYFQKGLGIALVFMGFVTLGAYGILDRQLSGLNRQIGHQIQYLQQLN